MLEAHGIECVPIPAQSPNCNPHAERFVKTVRTECLEHFVILSERHLRHLLKEFMGHYLTERYHQGIGSQIVRPKPWPSNDNAGMAQSDVGRASADCSITTAAMPQCRMTLGVQVPDTTGSRSQSRSSEIATRRVTLSNSRFMVRVTRDGSRDASGLSSGRTVLAWEETSVIR